MNNQQIVNMVSKVIVALCAWVATKWGFSLDGAGIAATAAPMVAGLLATWWGHASAGGARNGNGGSNVIGLLLLAGLGAFVFTGCAHVHDASNTSHCLKAYGAMVPPGWTVVKPNVTNTATGNAFTDYDVVAPGGTNAPGFFSSLVNRPKVFLAYREEWQDRSGGGGTFLLTDPQASQLSFTRTNQAALGGSRGVTVGAIQSTITTNAVSVISAGGTAVGNVIGAAASAAAGK